MAWVSRVARRLCFGWPGRVECQGGSILDGLDEKSGKGALIWVAWVSRVARRLCFG
ncbi:hypothetical protein DPMN_083829 [Dreissena polymorpha]|uniref:Uncharacterized protein n=1 Tax=Dreissena polymorpha TaxID=45954 RepID=A0A9D3YA13_DREPO|nr:hypothetical protein DPMN_083829 [Dreissena polymorpha]